MLSSGKSNYDNILGCTSPCVSVHYHTQAPPSVPSSSSSASASSSVIASGAEAKVVRRPRIALSDLWDAYEEWSCYALGVPLSVENIGHKVIQYYVPSLSAMQIFTIKPFADDSSPRSSEIGGRDGTETRSDDLAYKYCQFNEIMQPYERGPLNHTISELAEQYSGLYTLTSSDLSPKSWISVQWHPAYPVPSVGSRKDLSASFLTYHYLKPKFPEAYGEAEKVNEQGASRTREVVLRPFAAATYKAFGNLWIMPGTSDHMNIEAHECDAAWWLKERGFCHSDYSFFMSRKYGGMRR